VSVPVLGFEEDGQEDCAPEDGVHGAAFQEAVEGVGSPVGEVGAEAVAPDVFHFVFVRERGNGTLGILFAELFVEEDEVSEAAADFH